MAAEEKGNTLRDGKKEEEREGGRKRERRGRGGRKMERENRAYLPRNRVGRDFTG